MQKERILYPCYFRSSLLRREGRRVPRSLAMENPTTKELGRVLAGLGIEHRVEEAHHPSHWGIHEGRVVAVFDGSKEELIRKVASGTKKGK